MAKKISELMTPNPCAIDADKPVSREAKDKQTGDLVQDISQP